MNEIERIATDILALAKAREAQASDLVAAIHAVWMEAGLVLGKEMDRIRREEREENQLGSDREKTRI